jgi:hypothetical protein
VPELRWHLEHFALTRPGRPTRWPALAARLRGRERIVAESADRSARQAAAAEISQILRRAESADAVGVRRIGVFQEAVRGLRDSHRPTARARALTGRRVT